MDTQIPQLDTILEGVFGEHTLWSSKLLWFCCYLTSNKNLVSLLQIQADLVNLCQNKHTLVNLPDINAAANTAAVSLLLGLCLATTGPYFSYIMKSLCAYPVGLKFVPTQKMIYNKEPHKIKGKTQYLKTVGIQHSGEQDQFVRIAYQK